MSEGWNFYLLKGKNFNPVKPFFFFIKVRMCFMSIYRYEIKYKKWIRQSVGMLTVSKMSPLEGPSPETSFRAFKKRFKAVNVFNDS